jgi:hypothetical protein
MLIYSLYTIFKGSVKRENFGLSLILLLIDNICNLVNYLAKLDEMLINTIDLFLRRRFWVYYRRG